MENPAGLDQLMKALAQGDRRAFTPVFERLWPQVLQLCVRLTGNDADGADVAQTTMLHIARRANEYDWHRPALPWALGIATWECRTLRKQLTRRRETSTSQPDASDSGLTAEEQVNRLVLQEALEAMGTLSQFDQEVLSATFWETPVNASGATLRKRRSRALVRLRDAFRRLYGFD